MARIPVPIHLHPSVNMYSARFYRHDATMNIERKGSFYLRCSPVSPRISIVRCIQRKRERVKCVRCPLLFLLRSFFFVCSLYVLLSRVNTLCFYLWYRHCINLCVNIIKRSSSLLEYKIFKFVIRQRIGFVHFFHSEFRVFFLSIKKLQKLKVNMEYTFLRRSQNI